MQKDKILTLLLKPCNEPDDGLRVGTETGSFITHYIVVYLKDS
jgi:hypothetical protein